MMDRCQEEPSHIGGDKPIDYNSPLFLMQYLKEHSLGMQKRFGQNFLVNADVRQRIVDAIYSRAYSDIPLNLWEVGPGLGAMTSAVLKAGGRVTAFEIDRGFCAVLRSAFRQAIDQGRIRLIEGDFLKLWENEAKGGLPDVLFGNLPYNIASLILTETMKRGVRFPRIVVMLQKEVVRRLVALAGDEDYGFLTVLVGWGYTAREIMVLKGGNFWPRPKVDSAVVELIRRGDYPGCNDPDMFIRVIRTAFSSRRKTIRNNLMGMLSLKEVDIALKRADIPPLARAEELGLKELLRLSDVIGMGGECNGR